MREVVAELLRWWDAGETVGVGTVTGTFRSAPRPAGAAMLVGPDGTAVGSVSGGCVEGAVYELATSILTGERDGPVLQRYGITDDDAFTVGLTCGGIIDIFVEALSRQSFPEFGVLAAAVAGFATMLWACGLPRLNHPVHDMPQFERASQDRFLLLVAPKDGPAPLRRRLEEAGALLVSEMHG